MKRICALALLAFLGAGSAGAQVAPLVVGELSETLSRIKADVSTAMIARRFGEAYVRDWWAANDAVLADAVRHASYLGVEGPACAALREREGDKSSAWITCTLGLEDSAKLLSADLSQLAAVLPDWERMARQIDSANATITPLVDKAIAMIDETNLRLKEKRY
ncbi:MAG: hypothetical protein GC202_03770 [Alphaproteobacteria bacterium]|nr:hypothetical protein [Alphaproteobacteria bacterium]